MSILYKTLKQQQDERDYYLSLVTQPQLETEHEEQQEQEEPQQETDGGFNVFEHTQVDAQIPRDHLPRQDILFFIKMKIDFPKVLLKKLGEEIN